jgi:hypothetical protein
MHASVHKLETHGFMRAPIIRTMMERMYLMYGSMGRFLRALLMAISSDATVASNALPKRSRWVGYSCALTCLAFVPFMFVGRVDLTASTTRRLGSLGHCLRVPLAILMVMVGVMMIRKRSLTLP